MCVCVSVSVLCFINCNEYCVKISSMPLTASTTATTAAAATAAADVKSQVGYRQWSRSAQRRNAASRRRSSQSTATEEISCMAKLQCEYVKRKLEIKEQQHVLCVKQQEKKMKLIDLKEQYYAAKLRKLAEE